MAKILGSWAANKPLGSFTQIKRKFFTLKSANFLNLVLNSLPLKPGLT